MLKVFELACWAGFLQESPSEFGVVQSAPASAASFAALPHASTAALVGSHLPSPFSWPLQTSSKKNMPTHTHQTWGNNGNTNTQLHAISALTTPIEPLGRHLSRQLGPVARNPRTREPAKPVAECSWIRGSSRFTQPLRSFHFFRHSGLASGSTRQFS